MALDTGAALHASTDAAPRGEPRRSRRQLSALHWVIGLSLLVSAFVGLPRRLTIGPISGVGALTIVQVILLGVGILACTGYPKRLLFRIGLYWCFLMWAMASMLWASPSFEGAQNGVVYLQFGLTLLLSGTLARRDPLRMERLISGGVRWIDWVALTLVLRDVVMNGLPNDPEEGWLVGPRPLAVLGVVMLSWHLSCWYFDSRRSRLSIALWLLAILLSMSRTCIAVALVLVGLVVLLQTRFRPSRAALSAPALLVAASLTLGLVVYSSAFNERFFGGVSTQKFEVAGLQINSSGRINMWSATITSALDSPIVGQGMGSSQQLIERLFPRLGHPHNDYLRVWHDLGAVGVALLITAMASWMRVLWRGWYEAERGGTRRAIFELSAMLLLVGLMLVMVPDNALIYSFIMGPAGVLIGCGLGVRADARTRSVRRGGTLRASQSYVG
jgi:O-antigen ligase